MALAVKQEEAASPIDIGGVRANRTVECGFHGAGGPGCEGAKRGCGHVGIFHRGMDISMRECQDFLKEIMRVE